MSMIGRVGLIALALLVTGCDKVGQVASAVVHDRQITINRLAFRQRPGGDGRFCSAIGTFTNTGTQGLRGMIITLQFLDGQALTGTAQIPISVMDIAPGQTVTIDGEFMCNERGPTFEATAVAWAQAVDVIVSPNAQAAPPAHHRHH